MNETTDAELLALFAETGSDEAFGILVKRHVHLVYSVALRHTSNPAQAEEISQAVFVILARKARSLSRKTILPGWLYHTARLTSANFQRMELRRARREHEAYMQSDPDPPPYEAAWQELSPLLDEAMARLSTADRDALVLRFFENKTLGDTGQALGIEERAAQKRVARALEKLRSFFLKRGVGSTAAGIAALLSAHSIQAAPAALATTITATALQGSAVTASTLTLIKTTLQIMAWTKTKTAAAAGAVLLFVTGTAHWVRTHSQDPPIEAIRQVNTGLPEAQTRAKMLIMFAMAQQRIPGAATWCDTLNASRKLWPSVPTNTVFALNSSVAGRSYSRDEMISGRLPGDTVVFFEAGKPGWNQAGGPELLPQHGESIAIAFADGSATIVPASDAANLRWDP